MGAQGRGDDRIGVSPFLAVRNHRLRSQGLIQELRDDGAVGIGVLGRDFTYQDWRFLAKLSVAAQWERWELGLTLTTPSLGLFGGGDTSLNRSAAAQGDVSEITTNFQDGLSSDYRSPLSLGAGASRKLGRTAVHFAAEWFDSTEVRTVLDTEPFASQSTGEVLENDLVSARDSVVNFALGVEQELRSDVRLYMGFHTDFSAAKSGNVSNDTVTSWDLYHLSGGARFPVAGSGLTLGSVLAFGGDVVRENSVGLDRDLDVSYVRLTFILGFDFSFGS